MSSVSAQNMINTAQLFEQMTESGYAISEQLLQTAAAPFSEKTLPLWGIEHAAKLARTSSATIRRLEAAGKLPPPARNELNRRVYDLEAVNRIRAQVGTLFQRPIGSRPIRVISANLKGGTGKTTTAVHLAQYLALRGLRVLLVDTDPQGSTTNSFGLLPDIHVSETETLAPALIESNLENALELARKAIRKTYWHQLDLIASQLNMVSVDGELTLKSGADKIHRLRDLLDELEANYDVVVVDVPPALGLLSINAIVAADYLLVPMVPNMPDIASSIQYFSILSTIADHMSLAGMNILITRYETGPHTDAAASLIKAIYGVNVLNNVMLSTRELSKSAHDLRSIYEIDKPHGSRETYLRALNSMNAVNDEIFCKIQQIWDQQALLASESPAEVNHG